MPFPFAFVSRFKVFTSADAEREPTIAAGRDGRFSIEWESASGAGNVRSYVYAGATIGPAGLGSVATLGAATASAELRPDTAMLNNGSHVLVYEQVLGGDHDIYVRVDVKNANGTYTQGTSVFVNAAAPTGNQYAPEIAALAGGGFVVGWEDSNDSRIKLQRYDANGAAQGALISVVTNFTQITGLISFDLAAMNSGGFAVSYQGLGGLTNSKISAFGAAGATIVSNIDASAQTISDSHGAISLTQLANGDIVAAWYDGDAGGVGYRLFNASFNSLTGDFLISAQTGAIGDIPRLAPTLDGRFMVVFSNSSNGGVYGQMVRANGVLDGAAVLLSTGNTTTAGSAEIETTADGRLVVTWREDGDIYAAVYDPRTASLNVSGTSGADNYAGSDSYTDTLSGLGGDDALFGLGGNDVLDGGDGADTIEGGGNADQSYGGNGDDLIYSMSVADPAGESIGDSMYGGAGLDTIIGSQGADLLNGGADNDSLVGGAGIDNLLGERGNDTLAPGAGANFLDGGGGRDVATFDFAFGTASFSRGAGWSWDVTSGGAANNLFGVEVAQFNDRRVALREAARSDVSGDGTSDLVFHSAALGQASYYEVNPAGGYIWRNIGAVAGGFTPTTGDFNGDGEADVLWFNGATLGYTDVNSGGGGYVWRDIGAVGAGHQTIVGDYDGDGTSDVAFFNSSTGALSWYDVDPAGGYVWRNIGAVGPGYTPLTGDFNGDGETDIGWFNGTSLSYYDIGNSGGYTWNNIGSVGPGHTALTGDFNNDGTTDVAFINQATNQISFYAVNPAGGYTWHNIGFVAPGYAATAADANGDGKTDIVFAGNGSVSYYDIGPTGGYTWHNIGGVGAGYLLVA